MARLFAVMFLASVVSGCAIKTAYLGPDLVYDESEVMVYDHPHATSPDYAAADATQVAVDEVVVVDADDASR
ncbi:MAG: hypothetical protein U0271_13230 [Polyangiaceae bacterium]